MRAKEVPRWWFLLVVVGWSSSFLFLSCRHGGDDDSIAMSTSSFAVVVEAFPITATSASQRWSRLHDAEISTTTTTTMEENTGPSPSLVKNHHHHHRDPFLAKAGGILQLGPPEPLQSLPVGATVRAFRPATSASSPSSTSSRRHDFDIERLSMDPHIFLLRGVLTNQECEALCSIAIGGTDGNSMMAPAETVTQGDTTARKHCQVAWLREPETQSLARSLGNLLLSSEVRSHPGSAVEDMQVLDYAPGGEFVLHHDGEPRVLTILYYLNGVGETWFPLANTSPDKRQTQRPQNKQEALNLVYQNNSTCSSETTMMGGGLIVGGERIPINRGDAVAFYNYLDDGSGDFNWNSLHAGLPVASGDTHKWVANHWFRYGGFQSE